MSVITIHCKECTYLKYIKNTRIGWELSEKIKKQHKDGEHLKAVWLFPCKDCWDAKKACETHVDCMHALNDLAYRETVKPYGVEIPLINQDVVK